MGENHSALHCHDLLEAVQGNLTAVLPGEVQQQRGEHLIKNTRTCREGQMKLEYVIIVLYSNILRYTAIYRLNSAYSPTVECRLSKVCAAAARTSGSLSQRALRMVGRREST